MLIFYILFQDSTQGIQRHRELISELADIADDPILVKEQMTKLLHHVDMLEIGLNKSDAIVQTNSNYYKWVKVLSTIDMCKILLLYP